jgi:hypothetical protein
MLDDSGRSGGSSQLLIGTVYDDKTGDKLRDGGVKLKYWASDINAMTAELYGRGTGGVAAISATLASGATDDWAPTGLVGGETNRIIVTPDSGNGSILDGILATSFGDGFKLQLVNLTAYQFLLKHNAVGSASANRLLLPNATDQWVLPYSRVTIERISSNWMI